MKKKIPVQTGLFLPQNSNPKPIPVHTHQSPLRIGSIEPEEAPRVLYKADK
jgi:hypothetical protein